MLYTRSYLELAAHILLHCAVHMSNVDLGVVLESLAKLTPGRS